MKPKFEYIKLPADIKYVPGMYYVVGGRGSCKSFRQLKHIRDIITLCDDIDACNRELAKIERRNNDRTN